LQLATARRRALSGSSFGNMIILGSVELDVRTEASLGNPALRQPGRGEMDAEL